MAHQIRNLNVFFFQMYTQMETELITNFPISVTGFFYTNKTIERGSRFFDPLEITAKFPIHIITLTL